MEVSNPPFNWRKLGRIFKADGRASWMKHYSQVPTPVLMEDRIRIFFTTRPDPEPDGNFVSFTSFLDVDIVDPTNILGVHDSPVMPLGDAGAFDQFGTMPCCVLDRDGELWLYYVGWARAQGVPWQSSIGLAISRDRGLSFQRIGRGPLLTRTLNEPFVQGSPYVLFRDGEFDLWYLSGTSWVKHGERIESIYKLMHAKSFDGINWERDGKECVESLSAEECQARPAVIEHEGALHMWFSYRAGVDFRNADRGYGIGYAHSADGKVWSRNDALAGIGKSESGWDSEMVSYPSILRIGSRLLMFYCGNHMGRDGFGVAEAVADA